MLNVPARPTEGITVARCNCNGSGACVSTNEGNQIGLDSAGCLFVPTLAVQNDQFQLPADNNLGPGFLNTWTDSGLAMTLPEAGTYDIQADAGGIISLQVNVVTAGSGNTSTAKVLCRLWDSTNAVAVSPTVDQVAAVGVALPTTTSQAKGSVGSTGTIRQFYSVTGPTAISLQVQTTLVVASGVTATIIADSLLLAANTSMRYVRIG